MLQQRHREDYGGSPPENYERYFVPAIGAPLANDLLGIAALRQGERVLDVAGGTGLLARLASQQVGAGGTVAAGRKAQRVGHGVMIVATART